MGCCVFSAPCQGVAYFLFVLRSIQLQLCLLISVLLRLFSLTLRGLSLVSSRDIWLSFHVLFCRCGDTDPSQFLCEVLRGLFRFLCLYADMDICFLFEEESLVLAFYSFFLSLTHDFLGFVHLFLRTQKDCFGCSELSLSPEILLDLYFLGAVEWSSFGMFGSLLCCICYSLL